MKRLRPSAATSGIPTLQNAVVCSNYVVFFWKAEVVDHQEQSVLCSLAWLVVV
jgi:hypothetical protein